MSLLNQDKEVLELSQDITLEINIFKLEIMIMYLMLMMNLEYQKLYLLMMEIIRWKQLKNIAKDKD